MSIDQARVPAGVRAGGQFSTTQRSEAAVSLAYPLDGPVPTTLPELWEFADREASRLGAAGETELRDRIWSDIVRSVNPEWDVSVGHRPRVRAQMLQARAEQALRRRYADSPAVLAAADEIDDLLAQYAAAGAGPSAEAAVTAMLADLHLWSIHQQRVTDWLSNRSTLGAQFGAASDAVNADLNAEQMTHLGPLGHRVPLQIGAGGAAAPDASRAAMLLAAFADGGHPSQVTARRVLADVCRWSRVTRVQPLGYLMRKAEQVALDADRAACDAEFGSSPGNPYRRRG